MERFYFVMNIIIVLELAFVGYGIYYAIAFRNLLYIVLACVIAILIWLIRLSTPVIDYFGRRSLRIKIHKTI